MSDQQAPPDLLAQLLEWSPLESVAVVAAVLYLLLAIRENIWCWLFAGISTAIYIYLFFDARLYMESALNGFYFAMAIYGFVVWRSGRTDDGALPVSRWRLSLHVQAIAAIATISLISGYLLEHYTRRRRFPISIR